MIVHVTYQVIHRCTRQNSVLAVSLVPYGGCRCSFEVFKAGHNEAGAVQPVKNRCRPNTASCCPQCTVQQKCDGFMTFVATKRYQASTNYCCSRLFKQALAFGFVCTIPDMTKMRKSKNYSTLLVSHTHANTSLSLHAIDCCQFCT